MARSSRTAEMDVELGKLILSPRAYADRSELDEAFRWLRANRPVSRVEIHGYDPFWAITKHPDILDVSRQNDSFNNEDHPTVLRPRMAEDMVRSLEGRASHLFRVLANVYAPDHLKYRHVVQAWFMSQNLQSLEHRIRTIARTAVDRMASLGSACDFARDVAQYYPLRVVMEILGIPEQDEPRMLKLAREIAGHQVEDPARDTRVAEEPAAQIQQLAEVAADFEAYVSRLTETRRKDPRNDVVTALANAEIDGGPMGDFGAIGYHVIIATAGHDTASLSTSAAIWALCENPDMFRRVKANRLLVPRLAEEAVRYTTPVHHFMRSATVDAQIRGCAIAKGDRLMLCYASGNRDEEVFDEPDRFRIDRTALRHVAFGYGGHACLGQYLARLEMRIFFEELLERLESIELSGPPIRSASTFVGGPRTVPVRFELR